MRCRAKTANKHSIWVAGEIRQITQDETALIQLKRGGHYKNTYNVFAHTVCRLTGRKDRDKKEIYVGDFILIEYLNEQEEKEIMYCMIDETEEKKVAAVDVLTGEIYKLSEFKEADILVIGNRYDHPEFIEDISRIYEADSGVLPYIPAINVQLTTLPYWIVKCRKCEYTACSTTFTTTCTKCREIVSCNLATKEKHLYV